jgi:hypothetical protein
MVYFDLVGRYFLGDVRWLWRQSSVVVAKPNLLWRRSICDEDSTLVAYNFVPYTLWGFCGEEAFVPIVAKYSKW